MSGHASPPPTLRFSSFRRQGLPVLIALVSILVLGTRVDLDFQRIRTGISGARPPEAGRLSFDLPDLERLAGAPAALVIRLRGGAEAVTVRVLFDGVPLASSTVAAGDEARVDAAVTPSAGQTHRLDLVGDREDWRLRDAEIANVHGFSRGLASLVVAPAGRSRDHPLPIWVLIPLAVGLLAWRPRWDWPSRGAWRALHRAAVTLVLLLLLATLAAAWVTPFTVLLAPHTALLAVGILYADRLARTALLAVDILYSGRLIRAVTAIARMWRRSFTVPAAVILMAGAVLAVGLVFGSRSVGGADVYGYVSQAELLRQGQVRVYQPIAAAVPWPDPDWSLTPLGYAPVRGHAIVPTYPPGLPLVIVLFSLVFGPLGAFLVAPVSAAALVLLTYALGVRIAGAAVGLVAAAGIATSPTVLYMMLTPMSDVPVAVCWTASLLLATRRTTAHTIGAALAAGLAILIRPNLVFLAAVPLLVAMWNVSSDGRRLSMRRGAVFALTCAPFALFIGWWFNELYGSPLRSGYGETATLFAWEHVAENLARYPLWLWDTQGPLVFLAVLSPWVAARGDDRFLRLVGLIAIGLVTSCYLLYVPFDAWWFLRFFLVVFPLLFILSADVIQSAAARLAPATGHLALGLFAVIIVCFGLASTHRHGVLGDARADHRYGDVGRYASRHLPPNAVVYSMQHSGTVRHYADRLTVRWTHLRPDWLDRSIDYWREHGYEPVFLLDDWEVPEFTERFGSQRLGAIIAGVPPPAPCTHPAFVYWPAGHPGGEQAFRIQRSSGCE